MIYMLRIEKEKYLEIETLHSVIGAEEMLDEKPWATEFQAKEDDRPKKIDSKFVQVIVLLGFGGALLARYYAFIGYIPEIEWKESLTYLSVLALSGMGLLTLYGLLLFLPGFIWSELLVCDRELQGLMCFEDSQGWRQPCPVGVTKSLGKSFAIFLIIAHIPMIWGGKVGTVLIAGLVGLIPALYILSLYLGKELKGRPEKERHSLLARYLLFFSLSALVSLVAMVVIYQLLNGDLTSSARYDTRAMAMLAVCSLISVVANLAVALQYRQWRTRAVVTGIIAAFLLFIAGESIPGGERILSARIMAQFGVGDKSEHTLFPNAEGIKLATRLGLLPAPTIGTNAASIENASIPKIQILSGLGRSYYLEYESRRIVFPKDMVLAWEIPPAGKVSLKGQ